MQPGLVPQCNSDLADRLLFEPFPGYCSSIKPRQKMIGFSTRAGSGGTALLWTCRALAAPLVQAPQSGTWRYAHHLLTSFVVRLFDCYGDFAF